MPLLPIVPCLSFYFLVMYSCYKPIQIKVLIFHIYAWRNKLCLNLQHYELANIGEFIVIHPTKVFLYTVDHIADRHSPPTAWQSPHPSPHSWFSHYFSTVKALQLHYEKIALRHGLKSITLALVLFFYTLHI